MLLQRLVQPPLWQSRRCVHTLRAAVSFCGKGASSNKNKTFGEDAAVVKTWITPGAYQGASLIAVADGVGGWKRYGVDPAHLSRGLVTRIGTLFEAREHVQNKGSVAESGELPGCQELLTEAFTDLYNQGPRYAGGTTVCMGQFNPQTAEIQVLNLGDSGAWLIRDNNVIEKTKPDIQGMTPRQLTILPPWMNVQESGINLDPLTQTSLNKVSTWHLKPKDVLIFATDGFFDNVTGQESLAILESVRKGHNTLKTDRRVRFKPSELSDRLLDHAYTNSVDPQLASPFALRCLQEDNFDYWGGKPDDISVVVCTVNESELDFPDTTETKLQIER